MTFDINSTNIFGLAIGAFLVLNLIIGIWAGRTVKNLKDYAVGTKNYNTGALAMTYIATSLSGGGLLRGANGCFKLGICMLTCLVAYIISFPIKYKYFSSNFYALKDCLTMGDYMEKLYGKYSKIASGLLSGLYTLMWVGMEIQVLAIVFEKMANIEGHLALVISVLIISVYTIIGGIRGVIATDILQFVFLVASIFFISTFAVSESGGLSQIIKNIPADKLNFFRGDFFHYTISMFVMELIFSITNFSPPNFQRFIMTKDSIQVKNLLKVSLASWSVYLLSICMLSFAVYIFAPTYDGSNVFLFFFDNMIPESFKPIVVIGLVSFILSSGDSFLHSAGLSFYCDFLKPLIKKSINDLKTIRIVTFCLGLLASIFAIHGSAFFRIDYVVAITASSIYFPLTAGLIGLTPNKKSFWVAATLGSISFLICRLNFFGNIIMNYSSLIGASINAITFLITNFIESGGKFLFIENRRKLPSNHSFNLENSFLKRIIKIILFPTNFASWARLKEKKNIKSNYVLFGTFYSAIIIMPYLVWGNVPVVHKNLVLKLKSIALIFCSLLISHMIWPSRMKKYFAAFWYVAITYCLPFFSTMMVFLSKGTVEYTINIAIIIMLVILLFDWKSAFFSITIGVSLAFLFAKKLFNSTEIFELLSFDNKYLLIYQIIFGALVGLLFVKNRQKMIDSLFYKNSLLKLINSQSSKDLYKLSAAKDVAFSSIVKNKDSITEKIDSSLNFIKLNKNNDAESKLLELKKCINNIVEKTYNPMKLNATEIKT